MLWCPFLLIFYLWFVKINSLEDFDEVVPELDGYPKISVIKNGQILHPANNSHPKFILTTKPENDEEVISNAKKSVNKDQYEIITSIKNALNGTIFVSAFNNIADAVFNTNDTHEDARKSNCPSCSCGTASRKNRIVGGTLTNIQEYPWMVYLMQFNRFFCGASLINTKFLLSAAHCVTGYFIFDIINFHNIISSLTLKAVFMDNDMSTNDPNKFTRRIQSVVRHPGYSGSTTNNDISLLKLDREVQFSGLMRPVCLPPDDNTFAGYKGIVTGWGTTREGGPTSKRLRQVTLPILSNEQCRKTGNGRRITNNMMCAGYVKQGNKDSCQGDSGGPMHVFLNNAYRIVGVVSWGDGCGRPNHPGVYTRVNKYLNWIKAHTKDGCYC